MNCVRVVWAKGLGMGQVAALLEAEKSEFVRSHGAEVQAAEGQRHALRRLCVESWHVTTFSLLVPLLAGCGRCPAGYGNGDANQIKPTFLNPRE
jgi:hypothetical protein